MHVEGHADHANHSSLQTHQITLEQIWYRTRPDHSDREQVAPNSLRGAYLTPFALIIHRTEEPVYSS